MSERDTMSAREQVQTVLENGKEASYHAPNIAHGVRLLDAVDALAARVDALAAPAVDAPKPTGERMSAVRREQLERWMKRDPHQWNTHVHELMDELRRVEAELTAANQEFEAHTEAVGAFLREMYATLVDPVEEPIGNVSAVCSMLRVAARASRENLERLQAELAAARKPRPLSGAAVQAASKAYGEGGDYYFAAIARAIEAADRVRAAEAEEADKS